MFKYFVVQIPPAIASNIFDRLQNVNPVNLCTVSAESVTKVCVPLRSHFRSNFGNGGNRPGGEGMCVPLSVNRPVRQTLHAFQNDISRYCTSCTPVHPYLCMCVHHGACACVCVCMCVARRPSVRRSAISSRLRLRTPRYGRGACAMLVLGSSSAHRGRGAPCNAQCEHCAPESSNNSECLRAPLNVCAHLCAHLRTSHCSIRALRPHRCYRVSVRWL